MPAVLHNTPTLPAPRPNWPTMYDLPFEEVGEGGMPDEFHVHQGNLLNETFRPPAFLPDRFYGAVDMYLYYDRSHKNWYKRPDWFGAINVPRLYAGDDMRYSYVPWDEGEPPLIVVELLSDGTEGEDLGQTLRDARKPPPKWEVYERILRVPYYAVFSRRYTELRFFRLEEGVYQEDLGSSGRVWLPEAGLSLGLWRGTYHGMSERLWLRWFDADGNRILTYEEQAALERARVAEERALADEARALADEARARADQERARADEERARADQERACADEERARAERLLEMLRQLGYNPE